MAFRVGGWGGGEGSHAVLRPHTCSACGRKGWVGHCSHLRGWRAGSFCLRTWHLPQFTLFTEKAVLFFGQRCQQVRGIQLMPQVSVKHKLYIWGMFQGFWFLSFWLFQFFLFLVVMLCVSTFSFYFSLISCPFLSFFFFCCSFIIAVASLQKVDLQCLKQSLHK